MKSAYFYILISCVFNPLFGIVGLILLNMAESALKRQEEELAKSRLKMATGLVKGSIMFESANFPALAEQTCSEPKIKH